MVTWRLWGINAGEGLEVLKTDPRHPEQEKRDRDQDATRHSHGPERHPVGMPASFLHRIRKAVHESADLARAQNRARTDGKKDQTHHHQSRSMDGMDISHAKKIHELPEPSSNL